ncbi:hypothetical protein [Streptomyces xantholiticus]|uniref:hypothetical protein n=1 Tax=Streptomyces xantholiticus TaxID=68285 RepID=UPI00199A0D55|nr:hypothetical protein [Streptomyces xantholiticus]GGW59129.1 hypothetical protein GCM10010381_50490 [Streptomyces xantholiticus]
MTVPRPPAPPLAQGPGPHAELQIAEVRARDGRGAVCVVRCVGGVVRVGQAYEDGRLVVEWIDRYGQRVERVDAPHSAKVRLSGVCAVEIRERTILCTHGPRRYGYVGPREIWRAAEDAPEGRVVRSPEEFRAWAAEREAGEFAEPFTYVVDSAGFLRLAARRSEHVACAGRDSVRAAGEVAFRWDGGRPAVAEVSNQSTGYCPDPDCWPSVAAALDRAGIVRPKRFTHDIVFRHCPGCGELNIVREGDFVCVFCRSDLPAATDAGGLSRSAGGSPRGPEPWPPPRH